MSILVLLAMFGATEQSPKMLECRLGITRIQVLWTNSETYIREDGPLNRVLPLSSERDHWYIQRNRLTGTVIWTLVSNGADTQLLRYSVSAKGPHNAVYSCGVKAHESEHPGIANAAVQN